jgi:uncharacterized repeat protein (TIGR02543 family)
MKSRFIRRMLTVLLTTATVLSTMPMQVMAEEGAETAETAEAENAVTAGSVDAQDENSAAGTDLSSSGISAVDDNASSEASTGLSTSDASATSSAESTSESSVSVTSAAAADSDTAAESATSSSQAAVTYTITYDGNAEDAAGIPDAQTVNTSDTSASDTESTAEIPEGISAVLSSSIPQRAGYTFASWNTAQDGSGKTYKPGDTIEVTADITLFAQWEAERLVQSETPEVTRAAWISSLVSTFGMTVEEDNYPDNYYSDISSSDSCYKDIMEAVEFGLISLEAGAPFEPDAAATREFAAVTMNHCLGYQFNGSSYTYSDYTDVAEEDRASVQIAVDQGWLSLTDGKFLPNEPITSAESTAMIADAQKVLDTRKAPVSDSGVEFADGVIVIPDGTDVSCDADNNIVVINCPVSISSGRIFGYWINGIPGAGKASSVTVDGDKTIIKTTTEGYTYSDCFKKLNISGDSGLYESSYSPAENTTLTTESGDRVNIDVSDYEIEKLGGAGDSKITKEIHIHPTFSVNGSNVETSFSIDIVNIHIPYKIELLDKYAYAEVDADISMSGSISIDGLEGMNTIPIGEFTTVFGNVVLEMAYNASGRITLQWKGTMGLGMEISDGKFRLIENFEKKEFSLAAEVDVKAGPRLSWDCTLLHGSNGISAQLYAEAGAELKYLMKAYDSGTPRICQTMIAWLYADAGASAECFDKSWSDSWVLYDASNSPVRSYTHVEDGVEVSSCSRGDYYCGNTSLHLDKYTYNTSRLSKYHTAVTGKYYDSATSSVVSLFKYTLSTDPDDGSKQVATITGYNGSVTNLYIPAEIDGYKVTKIGKGAFAECSLIGTISIPDCVTSIEQRAFEDCTSLTSLTLPKSLNNLDGNAFYGCSALSSVWIPKSITRCGNINYSYQGPFTDCGKLNDVKYEEGITNIPGYLFDRCSGLQSITIPDTVTEIGPNAFSNCPGLASVSLSSNLTKIRNNAFAEDSLIGTISIPDCVTSIEQRAFEDCTSLTSLTLPKSLNNLDGNAFYGCSALSSVWIPKSITRCGNINYSYQGPFTDCGKLNDVKYEEGITNIPGYLFDRCSGLQSITIPDTVTEIGPNAFSNCPGLASVSLSSNLTKIRNNAFAEDSLIGTISIPDCVTSIEQRAFEDCTSLTSLTLPKSLNNLDGNAFYGCSALSSVWIPKSITRCGNINYSYQGPFTDCGKLNDVKYEEGITNIPGYLFDRCSGLQNITIPDTVTEIGHCSFSFCSKLTDVKFSANLTKIGKSAFYEDPLLSTADVPSSVKDIEDNVFYECSSLKTFSWPATGTSMGDYVFYGCSALTDVTLPKDRVYINSYTFYGCSSLVSINLPNSLQHIENNAFQNCTKLSTITIPGSVLTIDNSAFQNCDSLVKVEIPNGVQTVGNDCFYDCDKLTDVTVADSVTSIGTEAFKSCDILANVKLGTGLTELKDSTFMDCPKIVSIVIPYYVTKIDAQVFKNDYGLTDITLPRALASIGNDTFSYPGKMTIHGISGTYAQTYANLKSIKFIDTSVPVTSVTVTPTLTTLFQDKTIHLSLSVQPANMTDSIVWTSSNETVATVDTSGTVSGKSAGTATITATVGSRKATCKVTVVKPVTYIYIKADKNALTVGETLQLHGYYSPSDASSNIAYWSTDNAAVVKIDRNSGLAVAVGAGTAVITITPKIGDCKGTYTITVTGGSGDGLPFTDLGTKDWVRTAVKYVYSNGLMSGTSATTFKPNDSLTRGMFAAILYRVAGKPAVTYTSKFSDVPAGKYYSLPITWASNTGLISGYGDTGRLGPANNITRGQIAKILYLYAKSKGYDLTATADLSGFADKDLLKGNFVTYMQWAVTKGLISGSTSGSTKYLHPGDSATRAQCAKMIKQFCENCAK